MGPIHVDIKFDVVLGGMHFSYRLPLWTPRDATNASGSTDGTVRKLREILQSDDEETLTRLKVGGEKSDDVFLERWLTSKQQNLEETAIALRRHAQWRIAFLPSGRVDDVIKLILVLTDTQQQRSLHAERDFWRDSSAESVSARM